MEASGGEARSRVLAMLREYLLAFFAKPRQHLMKNESTCKNTPQKRCINKIPGIAHSSIINDELMGSRKFGKAKRTSKRTSPRAFHFRANLILLNLSKAARPEIGQQWKIDATLSRATFFSYFPSNNWRIDNWPGEKGSRDWPPMSSIIISESSFDLSSAQRYDCWSIFEMPILGVVGN